MGGEISKNRLIDNETGVPINMFCLHNDERTKWIYGGSIPAYKSTIEYFRSLNIKTIVTLTIEPLKPGRNINHVPFDHDYTEWVNSDLEEKDLEGFNMIHIPIADSSFPTPESILKLNDMLENRGKLNTGNDSAIFGENNVYFHCWLGRGRTCTVIIYILMKLYNMSYDEAYSSIRSQYNNMRLTDAQIGFLTNTYKGHPLEPIILTPKDNACYRQ